MQFHPEGLIAIIQRYHTFLKKAIAFKGAVNRPVCTISCAKKNPGRQRERVVGHVLHACDY